MRKQMSYNVTMNSLGDMNIVKNYNGIQVALVATQTFMLAFLFIFVTNISYILRNFFIIQSFFKESGLINMQSYNITI